MTILEALVHRYDRLAADGKMPIPGYGPAQISFTIVLRKDGTVTDIQDERSPIGKKYIPKKIDAPQAPSDRRGEKIVSGNFWDTADYALGVPRPDVTGSPTAQEKLNRKAVEKHQAFKEHHQKLLAATTDEGCIALLRFLESWQPDQLASLPNSQEVPGQNVAFKMQGEKGYIHNRKDAFACFSAHLLDRAGKAGICLVTGKEAPIARLHLPIKGVGDKLAPLVSFNEDAFTSYSHSQGANAPVSEAAAFAYATALNGLLEPAGRDAKDRPLYTNRVMLGDTSTVFWAEHPLPEQLMQLMLGEPQAEEEEQEESASTISDVTETTELRTVFRQMQDGLPLRDLGAELHPDSRAFVLGLSPNAARLSVRFWEDQSFADFTRHFQDHWRDLQIEPRPRGWPPSIWRLLLELAPQRESENIPKHLTGEVMRAILTGQPYPQALLVQTIMRIRADGDVNGLRVALAKAVITRQARRDHAAMLRQNPDASPWRDPLVALDRDEPNIGYRLGRLFALLDYAQYLSVGAVNAGVKEKFFASASSTPRRIFPSLLRMSQNHLSDARKHPEKQSRAAYIDSEIKQVMDGLTGHLPFPTTLTLDDQGRFIVGFYHQKPGPRGAKPVADAAPDAENGDIEA